MTTRIEIGEGAVVGGYQVERLLGRGGMSSVYVARDLVLERDVALKIIAPELADDERFVRRFRRESRIAAALEHPAVVPVYDAGEAGDLFYIAMRLVPGADLRAVLAERGPLEPDEALALLAPVAGALDAAHALGIVHRDVKPGNILVSDDGRSYLADFGLTKSASASTAPSSRGELVGTVEYVPPEQIRGDDVDGRADQYSLACVLFECITGRTPFARSSELATLWAHVEEVAPLPSALRAGLPRALDEAVAIALAKEPKARLASCSELVERSAAGTREAGVARGPFVGLAAFDVADAPYFFGRERLIAELGSRLANDSFLALVGPSGSGKSSVLRAGLLPALAQAPSAMDPVVVRPGANPSTALEAALNAPLDAALEDLAAGRRLLLAVDQFEELFTTCDDHEERAGFVAALVRAASDPDARAAVVIAMRADYFGACAAYPELASLLGGRTVLVGAMSRADLARAIEGPAARAGVGVDRGLTDAILGEVGDEPGTLPLLSTALQELWAVRDGDMLTRHALERTGGVRGAIARLAEQAYESLAPAERDAARRILLRLADSGPGREPVRRRVPLTELEADRDPHVSAALRVLTSSRIVTADEESVEVAHEALFREWPRLRAWLDQDAEGRAVRRALTDSASAWDAGGRDSGDLYRGARLASALEWADAHHGSVLNELERSYLAASRTAAEREALRERRTNRRLRVLLAASTVLLAATATAAVIAVGQRSSAREAAARSEVQRLATLSRAEKELDRSILLARQAVDVSASPEARGALLASLVRAPAAIRVFRPGVRRPGGLAAAATGDRLLVWNGARAGALLDARSGRVVAHLPTTRGRFTDDGRTAILIGERAVRYVDAKTGRKLRQWRWPTQQVRYRDVAPDGRTALAVARDGAGILAWDTRASSVRFRLAPPHGQRFSLAAFAPDGRRVVTVARDGLRSGAVRYAVWLPPAVRPLEEVAGADAALEPVADARVRTLAWRAGETGAIGLVDLASGARATTTERHLRAVADLALSRNGRLLATAGEDGVVMLWDARTGARVDMLTAHTGPVRAVAFADRGATLYSTGSDGAVIAWDVAGSRRLGRPFQAAAGVGSDDEPEIAVSGDGRLVAAIQRRAVAITNARTLTRVATLRVRAGEDPRDVAFSRDGSLLAAGMRGRVVVWRRAPWRRAPSLGLPDPQPGEAVVALAFSPDGETVAAATSRGRIVTWNTRTGRAHARTIAGSLGNVAFAPDGEVLAVALNDPGGRRGFGGFAAVLDAATLDERYRADVDSGYGRARALAFSPDGGLLATGGGTGEVRFFDAETGKARGRTPLPGAGWLVSLDFAADGEMVVAAGADGRARLIDLEDRTLVGGPLPARGGGPGAAAFSADGARVFTVDGAGDGARWDVSPERLEAYACRVARRTLTRAEWERFLPSRTYEPACR